MFGRRLQSHDANQVELKLAYGVHAGQRKQRYRVETWIYVPRTLGVTRHNYSSDLFYQDTSAFVRLKTPTVALSSLGSDGNGNGWLGDLSARFEGHLGGDRRGLEETVQRLKLVGCIFRSGIRDESRELEGLASALPPPGSQGAADREEELARRLGNMLDDADRALERIRQVCSPCDVAAMPDEVRHTWRGVDEYLALFTEEVCTTAVRALEQRGSTTEALVAVRGRLADAAVILFRHRIGRGYPSFVRQGEPNEHLPFRRKVLKRMLSSALFLDVRQEEPGRLARDLVGMLAAALAMLFAVLAALWAQARWDLFSGAFIAASVVSYMVKDRIKEWFKRYWSRRQRRIAPDRVIEIRSGDGKSAIGHCTESFHVLRGSDVEREVDEVRHMDHPSGAATAGRPETVLHYTKEVTLSSAGLARQLPGVTGLNDIIRISLGRLRERMDSPIEDYVLVDPDTRELVTVPCARVYHVNIVLRYTTGRGRKSVEHMDRVRVILDQDGIRRVVPVRVGPWVDAVDPVPGGSLVDEPELA